MKFVIVQAAKRYITITPAETGRSAPSADYNKLTKNDVNVTFGSTKIYILPDNIIGQVMSYPKELAEFVKNALLAENIQIKDIYLIAEGDEFISQEYQHAKAKANYLASFANLELQSIINDKADKYTLLNCEYSTDTDDKEEFTAALFAMQKTTAAELKSAFEEQYLRLYKVIPAEIAIIKAANTAIVSYDKVVALFSMDYASMRIAVMENGNLIYCHNFSSSPIPDIANILASDLEIPLEEALALIRKNGFGVSDECNFNENKEEIKRIVEHAASHVVRNLRMVLLGKRLELDQIYLCDSMGIIPNFIKYLRSLGFTCDINNIADSFATTTNVAKLTDEAAEQGFKSASFYTYTYLLNCGSSYQNNLLVSTRMNKSTGISIGLVASIIFLIISIAGVGFFMSLSWQLDARASSDQAELTSPKYDEIKGLISKREKLMKDVENLSYDKDLMPKMYATTEETFDLCFKEFTKDKKVKSVSTYSFNHEEDSMALMFETKTFQNYVDLSNEIPNNDFFVINKAFSANKDLKTGIFTYSVTLGNKTAIEAKEKAEKEKAEQIAANEDASAEQPQTQTGGNS